MDILLIIITYFVAIFLALFFSYIPYLKSTRFLLFLIASFVFLDFIENNIIESPTLTKLSIYANIICFFIVRIKLYLSYQNRYLTKAGYENLLDLYYAHALGLLLFLLAITSSFFTWLDFGITSGILIFITLSAYFSNDLISAYANSKEKEEKYERKNNYDKYDYFYEQFKSRNNYNNENYNDNSSYEKEQKTEQKDEKKTGFDSDDPYEVLGVKPSDDFEYIKKHYRKLVRQYHPDVCKDPALKDVMSKINNAYEKIKELRS